MKQVDTAELEEGAVIWKAVCFITPLSCHEGTTPHTHTHTHTYEEKKQKDKKGKERERTNLNV